MADNGIPIQEIAGIPIGLTNPDTFSFSPDNKYVAYLYNKDKMFNKSLWILNVETHENKILYQSSMQSEEDLSPVERLRRERQRQVSLGVTFYQWAEKSNKLIFRDKNCIYGVDFDKDGTISKIIDRDVIDPQLSPDGNWVAYVFEKELFIVSFTGENTKQMTFSANLPGISNGVAEYVAQEELKRPHGYWWSPDSKNIAFTQINESHIPLFRILNHTNDALDEIRYPFVGGKNVFIKLGVVNIHDNTSYWLNLGDEEDIYLARVNWLDEKYLTAQILNREQNKLKMLRFDVNDVTSAKIILTEESEIWINVHNLFKVINHRNSDKLFLWGSERTGFTHLYLYDFDGNLKKTLTSGNYIISEIICFNDEKNLVYVISTSAGPLERHLYSISLIDGNQERISIEAGTHKIVMDHQGKNFIDIYESISIPPTIFLKSTTQPDSKFVVYNQVDPRIEKFNLKAPEIVNITTPDDSILYGALYKPDDTFGSGPYPTIVMVYGGPHVQIVTNKFFLTTLLRLQNLRKHGFLVFILDNRGSANRGLAFEGVLKNQFGKWEVKDQVYGVEWLIDKGLADKNRIGIFGWSYGGFMTLMCLSKAPHLFKAGFAGAPTNDMRDYDTCYTERYLGLPDENEEGYNKTSVVNSLSGLQGSLTITHGLIDENVHFRHSAKIINKLNSLQKDYSLILLPESRHSLRKLDDRILIEKKLLGFFRKALG